MPTRAIMLSVVHYEDMSDEERDRFVYLVLGERGLEAVVRIMQCRHGPQVTTEQIMRFAFKAARNRMIPKHLKQDPVTPTDDAG